MTIAGLCAYGIPRAGKTATAFLVDGAAIPGHPAHHPLLVIHRRHIDSKHSPRGLEGREVPLDDHVHPDWLDEYLYEYAAWDIGGLVLQVREHATSSDLKLGEGGRPGKCPEAGDWSSLGWLVDMSKASTSSIDPRSKFIRSRIHMRHGLLHGSRPVEHVGEDATFGWHGAEQAFTDAVLHQWAAAASTTLDISGDASASFTPKPHRNRVDLFVLNLPTPETRAPKPGHHFLAFYEILQHKPTPRPVPEHVAECQLAAGRVDFRGGSYCMAPLIAV
jgi:hypothetical protein